MSNQAGSNNKIEIYAPFVRHEGSDLIVEFEVRGGTFPDTLRFIVDSKYKEFIDTSLNAALTALLIPSMRVGTDISLNGDISEKLYLASRGKIQYLVKSVLGYESIKILHSGNLLKEPPSASYSATGFSGGVDSYSILNDYYFNPVCRGATVDFLVFSNIGANGTTSERDLFERRKAQAESAAAAIGLPLMVIDSNMDDFYVTHSDLHFFKTHTFRNSAVAHLISGGVSLYRYAAACGYKDAIVASAETIGYIDPVTLPLLSSERMDLQSEGAQYRRSEKITQIVGNPVVQNNLYVCVDHFADKNCSVCQKCVRTLLVIELLGYLDRFGNIFNIGKYLSVRDQTAIKFLVGDDAFSKDVSAMMRLHDFRLSWLRIVEVTGRRLWRRLKKSIKNVVKRA